MQTTLRSLHHDKKRSADPLGRAYGRFLELPPAVVLWVLWLAGAGASRLMRAGVLPLGVVAGGGVN